jgi:hypothetical protein
MMFLFTVSDLIPVFFLNFDHGIAFITATTVAICLNWVGLMALTFTLKGIATL